MEQHTSMSPDFSHSGEYSKVIRPLFAELGIGTGFLVDVGAFGSRHSNTWNLILRGWHGLYIDADQWAYEECVRAEQESAGRVKAVKALIVPKAQAGKDVTFYRHGRGMHSVLPDWLEDPDKHMAGQGDPEVHRGVRLSTVLDTFEVPEEFEFLDIDIEGLDGPVVVDLLDSPYRPKVIMWETVRSDPEQYERLSQEGYRFHTRAGVELVNEFWVRECI